MRAPRTGIRYWALAVVALYALIVASAPVLHHDFTCHEKNPGHCVACVASPSAPRAVAKLVVEPVLAARERVVDEDRRSAPFQLTPPRPGRAPPAA